MRDIREIKFRGRRIDNSEWVYGSFTHCHDGEGHPTIIPFRANYHVPIDSETVGQYTGLNDRNGKGREMYEGDVYKQDSRYYLIEWSEYSLGWVVRSLKSNNVLPGHLRGEVAVYDDYEYVGTIYEHPHLLGGNQA
jgi:hypothetical protein